MHSKTHPLDTDLNSEKPSTLKPLLSCHPNWKRFKRLLKNGSEWPLDALDKSKRFQDVNKALTFGNHKGASSKPSLLQELVKDDVIHGFSLPLPLLKIQNIKGILFAPLNIQPQNTINKTGRIIPKDRMTHNQSFKWTASGTSVNSRVTKNQLLPCVYWGVIQQLVNWMVAARNKYPRTRIYSTKIDFKAAFRRLHLNSSTAVQCCTQIPELKIALITHCLTFGGAPCPFEWGVISESICNLAMATLLNENWDPNELHAPNQDKFPEPQFFHDNTPFGKGRELIFKVKVNKFGIHDIYIDDLIGLSLDLPDSDNRKRFERAPLLAMDIYSRQPDPNEPIPHYKMAARKKLDAEGLLSKTKMILGGLWNFCNLTISLPENKLITWTDGIKNLIAKKKVCKKELETTIGRLTHVSMIIPPVHHFLSRLRKLLYRIKNNNRRMLNIPAVCIDDLHLMKDFLQWGNKGIRMN
jgi:hypothetical protein